MRVKLGRILNATQYFERMNNPAAQSPFQRLMDARIPGENVKLVKIEQRFHALLKEFEDRRQALIKRHGEEKDGVHVVPEANFAAFNADLMELVNEDVEIAVPKLRQESIELSGLSGADTAALAFLVEGLSDDAAPKSASVTGIETKRRKKVAAPELPAA